MIYIENNNTDPEYNLAFEEYVFQKLEYDEPILLLWQNAPAVIIGKYQNTLEEINYDFIEREGVKVVRRNTGGGAVYHDLGNLNYSFIIPDVQTRVDFKTFTIPVVKALQSQGVDAVQTGRNDILVDGKKFSGNAQQFSKHRLLHHGTLMFDVDMDNVSKALNAKAGKFRSKATKSVRSRVTNLKPYMSAIDGVGAVGTEVKDEVRELDAGFYLACDASSGVENVAEFKALLLRWFDNEYGIKKVELSQKQLNEINELKTEKYSSKEWNYGRSPNADVVRGEFFRCGHIEFHFSIEKHIIKETTIVGDFFSSLNIEELEKSLVGVEYEREAILKVLRELDLEGYFGDVTADELVAAIV